MLGLQLPPSQQGPALPAGQLPITSYGTVVAISQKRLSDAQKAAVQERQSQPEIIGLVGYIRECWYKARDHKRMTMEPKLFDSLRQRQGQYDPDKLAQIKLAGGSEVYMTLTGNKCRAASSWIKDVYLGQQGDRPWCLEPGNYPDVPPEVHQSIVQQVGEAMQKAMAAGYQPAPGEAYELAQTLKTQTLAAMKEDACRRADRMADKMEDQLLDGGWMSAMADFVDDLVTFQVAVMKGPVVRRKKKLDWEPGPNGTYSPVVKDKLVPEWERVSPFDIYPSPDSYGPEDGYMIERHRLSRAALLELKGVEGYDDDAIDYVIGNYYVNGWQEWLFGDAERADVEGRSPPFLRGNPDGKIDALQFWGRVNGHRLIDDWKMSAKEVPDPNADYEVEVWLINELVVKCVLNPDPLMRRPYYTTSFAKNPGGFYGNSLPEIIADIQAVCNATARAMVNNMGIASGPQVAVTVDRLPPGEDVTNIYPWKVWQFTSDPSGSQAQPVSFFQPNPMVAELMGLYEKFEQKADDYTGIPKYLVGGETTGGIGRTSSGLSMMLQNAGKAIKQVVTNIDIDVTEPMLRRLYDYNMRYATDPDLKGDIDIVVKGANAAVARDALHLRRNEFLQATANPTDMQIIGAEGRASILRVIAKDLELNTDRVVPDAEMMKIKSAAINQNIAAQNAPQPGGPGAPQGPTGPQPLTAKPQGPKGPQPLSGHPVPHPSMAPSQPKLRQNTPGNPSAIMTPVALK